MKTSERYVELTYREGGSDEVQFRAHVVEAGSPRDAVEEATRNLKAAHPRATEVEEFMQRVVTPGKAESIRRKMGEGTWTGWRLS